MDGSKSAGEQATFWAIAMNHIRTVLVYDQKVFAVWWVKAG